jgi:hypothetical protein
MPSRGNELNNYAGPPIDSEIVKNTQERAETTAEYGRSRMDLIVLPVVNIEKATVHDTLLWLSAASVDYDPNQEGFHFCIGLSGIDGIGAQPFSFHGTNVALSDVAAAIAQTIQGHYAIRPAVLFMKRGSAD